MTPTRKVLQWASYGALALLLVALLFQISRVIGYVAWRWWLAW